MVDNVNTWTYWAILEEDGVMSLQVIHFASACFAIIRLHICPKYLVSNGTYFQTWQAVTALLIDETLRIK
jgi:hypothetical protein